MFTNVLLVALGGSLGATARFLVSAKFSLTLWDFALGTFFVNFAGSFLMGFLLWIPIIEDTKWRFILLIGFLGSFTTMSTFAAENMILLDNQKTWLFLVNSIGTVVLCTTAILLGRFFAMMIFK